MWTVIDLHLDIVFESFASQLTIVAHAVQLSILAYSVGSCGVKFCSWLLSVGEYIVISVSVWSHNSARFFIFFLQ